VVDNDTTCATVHLIFLLLEVENFTERVGRFHINLQNTLAGKCTEIENQTTMKIEARVTLYHRVVCSR